MTEIQKAIAVLFPTGVTTEVRVPKSQKYGTISGYFNDPEKMAQEIEELSGQHTAIYYVTNPVSPDLLARSTNAVQAYAQLTTSDDNVLTRRWLLIDIDPVRAAGISSTYIEKLIAEQTADAVREWLTVRGWPEPVQADSGNGFHLLYRIDLANSKENTDMIRSILIALAKKFVTDRVKVDRSVFNASRITKAYGTKVCKGTDTPERPHRMSQLISVPNEIMPVRFDKLKELASQTSLIINAPTYSQIPAQSTPITQAKMEEFLSFYGIDHLEAEDRSNGSIRWVLPECPFNPEHSHGEVAVFLREDGPGFHPGSIQADSETKNRPRG